MSEYTTYTCDDGRVRAYVKESNKVISYPRLIMEQQLNRPLLPEEQVHHKNKNPLDNETENLEIRILGEHQREHSTKYLDKLAICEWCSREFLWTAKQQRTFYSNRSRKNKKYTNDNPFCSKSCASKHGRKIQLTNRISVNHLAESADFQ